ncbi:MAG: cytochrome B [Rickettsiales bacterium]|nr:cytochrome B [Rickettsiales bacterium]|tara:strand:+ start:566 stop:1153 length:588 start_codon:yes stop_codon:yes gene_type:complete
MKALRKLYDKVIELSAHPHAVYYLFIISFLESSIFPIPPDVMLLPMCMANRKQAFKYAAICLLGSVLGGIAGYAIGFYLFDLIGASILNLYGFENSFIEFKQFYDEYGGWFVAMAGITPFPYKVITILSGIVEMNMIEFVISSIASRGLRFFALAGLLWYFGPWINRFIDKYFALLTVLFFVFLIGGFAIIEFVI